MRLRVGPYFWSTHVQNSICVARVIRLSALQQWENPCDVPTVMGQLTSKEAINLWNFIDEYNPLLSSWKILDFEERGSRDQQNFPHGCGFH
jgi:hypothetical protein